MFILQSLLLRIGAIKLCKETLLFKFVIKLCSQYKQVTLIYAESLCKTAVGAKILNGIAFLRIASCTFSIHL